jgi:hypothetical protein
MNFHLHFLLSLQILLKFSVRMLLSGYAFCENRRREDRAFVVHVSDIR